MIGVTDEIDEPSEMAESPRYVAVRPTLMVMDRQTLGPEMRRIGCEPGLRRRKRPRGYRARRGRGRVGEREPAPEDTTGPAEESTAGCAPVLRPQLPWA